MRLDPPKTAGTSRPAPRNRNTPAASPPKTIKPRPQAQRVRGQQILPKKQAPRPNAARQLLEPDAATKRLLELTIDKQTGQLSAGAGGGTVLLSMARSLAERKGKAGTGSYLALASTGVPLASMGDAARQNAAKYLKDLAVRGEDLTGIPKVSVLDASERDQIRAVLKQNGVDPGPDASDAEILTATHRKKLSNIDILKNAPKSAGKALVGLPMGAFAAGQATGALAFQGDTKPLRQMGTGLVDYYGAIKNHPLAALQRDPVGTIMAVAPAKTLLGGGAGKIAKTGALGKTLEGAAKAKRQPLVLPKARLSTDPTEAPQVIPVLDQSPLRSNLIDQAAQRAAARLTQSSERLSRGRISKLSAQRANEARHAAYQRREELLQGVIGAKRKLTKEEKRAVTAIVQGVTPRQMAEYYRIKAGASPNSKHLRAQSQLWDKVAAKAPELNDRMTRYLDAAEPAVREREASLMRVTSIDEAKLQAREGITQAEVLNTIRESDGTAAPAPAGATQYSGADAIKVGGKTFYHGTNTPNITRASVDPLVSKVDGLFGEGFYLTDNKVIAEGYATARSRRQGSPTIHEVKVSPKSLIDLENPLPRPAFDAFVKNAEIIDQYLGSGLHPSEHLAPRLKTMEHATGDDVYRTLSDHLGRISRDEGLPVGEFTDNIAMLREDLLRAGFDGYTHVGGKRTGKQPHQVVILFDPRRSISDMRVHQTPNPKPSLADASTGRAPFYFPHVGDKPNFGGFLFKRGMSPTHRLRGEVKKNDLALFKAGKWQPDTRHLEARISSAPLAEESLTHLQGQFREFGRPATKGMVYDPKRAKLVRTNPKGARVEKIDVSGEGLAQQLRDVKGASGGDKDFLQRLESQIIVNTPDGRVPDEPGLILVPNEVMEQVSGTLRSMHRGGLLRGLQTATDAWRYMTLYLRGAYLTNNIAGNTLQAGIGGLGPVSVARALKYGDVVPKKLIGTGTMADMSRIQKLGGNADKAFGRAVNTVADSTVGRAVASGAGRNPIMRGNIAYENLLRKALYLRHAIPEAKTAANGSRFSRVTDGVLEHLKNNEVPEATQAVVDFLGDMRKKNKPNLRLSAPFYRWIEFITQLSLKTLPAKYPVRNELLQALGRSGNAELEKMGLVPPWLHGAIPVDTSVEEKDGSQHQMADLLATQGLNPFATIEQTWGRGPQGVAGVINPLVGSALNTVFGRDLETGFDLRDAEGQTISWKRAGEPSFWQALATQELRNLPFVNLVDPASYKPADALPLTGKRKYPKGARQPDMPTLNNILAYFTGARVRPTDLTLYNLQEAYKLIGGPNDELAKMGFDEDARKELRRRINVEMGRAKKKGSKGSKVEVPILNPIKLSVPTLEMTKAWKAKWGDELVPNHPEVDSP